MTNELSQEKKSVDKNQMENIEEVITEDERIEDKVDRDLADSFPASDAPGWTMGVGKRHPQSEET